MNPGEVTTIRVKFDLPGNYVWHCHILEHEEHDMMRPIVVLDAPPQPTAAAGTTKAFSTTTTSTASARLSGVLALPTTSARFSAGAVEGAVLPPTVLELGEVPPLLVPDTGRWRDTRANHVEPAKGASIVGTMTTINPPDHRPRFLRRADPGSFGPGFRSRAWLWRITPGAQFS